MEEQRVAAKQAIYYNKMATSAVSKNLSKMAMGGQDTFQAAMETLMSFTIGLGMSYNSSILCQNPLVLTLYPSTRSLDALVYLLGLLLPIYLYNIIYSKNKD